MPEYIDREAVQEILKKYSLGTRREIPIYPNEIICASMDVDAIPAADVVPMAVHRQVMQERDLAIQQLGEDYGVELGEKKADVAPVVPELRNALELLRKEYEKGNKAHAKGEGLPWTD